MGKEDTPLVCGGIYEFKRPNGEIEQSIMLCTLDGASAKRGWMQRFGLAREVVVEGSETMNFLTLVGGAKPPVKAKPAPKKEEPPKEEHKKKIRRKKKG